MQSNQFIAPIILISNILAQVQGQIGGQVPMAGQPQVGFTQPGQNQPTTAQQWTNSGVPQPAGSNPQASWAPNAQQPWAGAPNTQASWSRPAAQPAWPQGTTPQAQMPMAGQPQAQPVQNQPVPAQRWPNAVVPQPASSAPQPQGAIAQPANPQSAIPPQPAVPVSDSNQGIPIDNVGDVNSSGGITGTVPFNTPTQNLPASTQETTQASTPTGSASFKLLPSAIGLLAILSLF